jgi:DNA-binding response OmpR family regulator
LKFSHVKTIREKILVVEDDQLVRDMIVETLKRSGYRVLEAEDGTTALQRVQEDAPDLAIMDVRMPKMGGMAALEIIRQRGYSTPVLILSGRGEVDDRLQGLGLGADDYMVKPFDHRELLARVKALLRRTGTSVPQKPRLIRHQDIVIDLTAKRGERAGRPLPLTATEFSILEVLARHKDQPLSRDRLLDLVWGYTAASSTNTVETHIWRLRKKLGDSADDSGWIRNLPGLGYVLAPSE